MKVPRFFFASALFVTGLANADFRLPFSNPVEKIISLPVESVPSFLEKIILGRDVGLELRFQKSTPIDGKLLKHFRRAKKIIVYLEGELDNRMAAQLYRLRPNEVWFKIGKLGLDDKIINSLYTIGPVHKVLVLGDDFEKSLLEKARRVRFSALAFPATHLSEEKMAWLGEEEKVLKVALLPADFEPQLFSRLVALKPLRLVVATDKNRLSPEQYRVLAETKGVEITIVLDGRATVQDLEPLTTLENLHLVFRLENPPQFIPGLGVLLEKIGPPAK